MNRWQKFFISTLMIFPSAGVFAQEEDQAEKALAAVISGHERLSRELDPISAGQEGDRDALKRWADVRPSAVADAQRALIDLRRQLQAIDPTQLSASSELNHRLLMRLLDEAIEEVKFDLDRLAFQNDSGFHTLADYVARTTVISSREDAEAWLARLEALPVFYEQNIANLRRGIRTKVTQPRIVVERVLDVARQHAKQNAPDSSLLLPFANRPASVPESAHQAFRARAVDLYQNRIQPSQQAFVTFLEREYLPAARKSLAVRTVPDGENLYRFLVRSETTTQLSPDEIHHIGLSEVARIRALMEETIRSVNFEGSFAEFLQMLRSDARFYASTPEELLKIASEIAKRADDRLPGLFGTLPRLTYGVRPVPAEIAEGYTTGRYWTGSMPLGQAGGYMVNTSKLDQRPLYELPALTVHEAVPGHHLQIALSQELTDIPYFRRNWSQTAFVEGWGLYAEFLGEEMGIYRDAYERFGRYSYEMWRACRLVADTGIHWKGWDIEQARRCFTENSALSPHNIQTELERYISWPAQALAYKVGELKLRELRQHAQSTLGERFNVREFHDLILLGGAMPLDVLEERVKEWVESKAQSDG
jgi:uncharacterized protein (DUF885 family)